MGAICQDVESQKNTINSDQIKNLIAQATQVQEQPYEQLPLSIKDIIINNTRFSSDQKTIYKVNLKGCDQFLITKNQPLQQLKIGYYQFKNETQQFKGYYEGIINQEGKADDQEGLYVHSNEAFYRGSIKQNKADGRGSFHSKQYQYDGLWEKDLPNGQGKLTNDKGVFESTFKNGLSEGKGEYQSLDSKIAYTGTLMFDVGDFKSGLFHGKGTFTSPQQQYEGEYCEGVRQGMGKLSYAKDNSYYEGNSSSNVGQFHNNQIQGRGTYNFTNTIKYEGQFQNGKPHGFGKFSDGQQLTQGIWIAGDNITVLNTTSL